MSKAGFCLAFFVGLRTFLRDAYTESVQDHYYLRTLWVGGFHQTKPDYLTAIIPQKLYHRKKTSHDLKPFLINNARFSSTW